MVLEARKRAILDLLLQNRGTLSGTKLSSTQKRLATYMERDLLVLWAKPVLGFSASRDLQTLKLTRAGLEALQADAAGNNRAPG